MSSRPDLPFFAIGRNSGDRTYGMGGADLARPMGDRPRRLAPRGSDAPKPSRTFGFLVAVGRVELGVGRVSDHHTGQRGGLALGAALLDGHRDDGHVVALGLIRGMRVDVREDRLHDLLGVALRGPDAAREARESVLAASGPRRATPR